MAVDNEVVSEGHDPVLLPVMLEALAPADGEVIVDATYGGGGYTRAIIEQADCRVVALDRDPEAIVRGHRALQGLGSFGNRITLVRSRFGALSEVLDELGIERIDGLVLDLGVSSFQLDTAARGFSFRADGPLDMRMSGAGPTAAELLAEVPERDLAHLLWTYGEEPEARKVARAIIARREKEPLKTTDELVRVVEAAKRRVRPGRSPATNVFQALRIAVNDELGELERVLATSAERLRDGGRLVTVAFHSLEDRIIKRFVNERGGRSTQLSRHALPVRHVVAPEFVWRIRGSMAPSADEIARNPRARSARLRAAQRVARARSSPDDAPASWRCAA